MYVFQYHSAIKNSGNDTETAPSKTAIAETPHIDTTHISNAADTAIFINIREIPS